MFPWQLSLFLLNRGKLPSAFLESSQFSLGFWESCFGNDFALASVDWYTIQVAPASESWAGGAGPTVRWPAKLGAGSGTLFPLNSI